MPARLALVPDSADGGDTGSPVPDSSKKIGSGVVQATPMQRKANEAIEALFSAGITVKANVSEDEGDFEKYARALEFLAISVPDLKLRGVTTVEEIFDSGATSSQSESTLFISAFDFTAVGIARVLRQLPIPEIEDDGAEPTSSTRSFLLSVLRRILPGQAADALASRMTAAAATQITDEISLYPGTRLQIAEQFLCVRFKEPDAFQIRPLNEGNTQFAVERRDSAATEYEYVMSVNAGPPFDISLTRKDLRTGVVQPWGSRTYRVRQHTRSMA